MSWEPGCSLGHKLFSEPHCCLLSASTPGPLAPRPTGAARSCLCGCEPNSHCCWWWCQYLLPRCRWNCKCSPSLWGSVCAGGCRWWWTDIVLGPLATQSHTYSCHWGEPCFGWLHVCEHCQGLLRTVCHQERLLEKKVLSTLHLWHIHHHLEEKW